MTAGHEIQLSIVIANYNYGQYLQQAIESIVTQCQGCCNDKENRGGLMVTSLSAVEIIVIDGGSNDESIDVIKRNEDKISYWVSERDKGQSDAFNKGFRVARGKYLTWLNADDIFLPGALNKIISAFESHPACDWFSSNMVRFRNDGTITEIGWGPHALPRIVQTFRSPIVTFGPSTFFSKAAFEKVGAMNVDAHYLMDTDYWVRMKRLGYRQRRINVFCWGFRMHEESKTADFDGHSVGKKAAAGIAREREYIRDVLGYKMSAWGRILSLVFRVLDLSLMKKFLYGFRYRKITQLGARI